MMDARDVVGPETLKKATGTKWWQYARLLDDMLYSGGVAHTKSDHNGFWRTVKAEEADKYGGRKFAVSADLQIRVNGRLPSWMTVSECNAKHVSNGWVTNADGIYVTADVVKAIRDLMHELEALAIRQVAP